MLKEEGFPILNTEMFFVLFRLFFVLFWLGNGWHKMKIFANHIIPKFPKMSAATKKFVMY